MQVLALHGFSGAPQSFAPLTWPEGTELFAPTLAGHFGQDLARGPLAPAQVLSLPFGQEVQRLLDWCERHGFKGGHLLGYSMGARIALGLLAEAGALFSGATLIGVNPGLEDPQELQQRQQLDAERRSRLEQLGTEAFMQEWETLPLFRSQRSLPAEKLKLQHELRCHHDAQALGQCLVDCGLGQMPNFTPLLRTFPQPIQLICGELDEKFIQIASRMLPELTRGQFHRIPGCGHNTVLEAPAPTSILVAEAMNSP